MITMLGSPRRCCDGLTRRETLKAGALSLLGGGFTLPHLFAAEELPALAAAPAGQGEERHPALPAGRRGHAGHVGHEAGGPARRCAASSSRSPAACPASKSASTCRGMAHWMHRAAVVRSVNHKAGCHNCLPSYTGYAQPMPDQHPRDTDPPSMGCVCEYLNRTARRLAGLRLHAVLARLGPGLSPRRALRRLPRQALRPADNRVSAVSRQGRAGPRRGPPADRARRAAPAQQHARCRHDHRPARSPPRPAAADRRRSAAAWRRSRPSAATTGRRSGPSTC